MNGDKRQFTLCYPGRRCDAPRCGAKTRLGTACRRKALRNGRCPNLGDLSTAPKSAGGIPQGIMRLETAFCARQGCISNTLK
jgi:hypothetical protein